MNEALTKKLKMKTRKQKKKKRLNKRSTDQEEEEEKGEEREAKKQKWEERGDVEATGRKATDSIVFQVDNHSSTEL